MQLRKQKRTKEPGFVPNPGSQTLFLSSESIFEVLLEGTRGGGKSMAMLMAFAKHVGHGYGYAWTGAIFRITYPELQDIIKKSKELFPKVFGDTCTYNEGRHEWNWTTGEKLMFRHGKTEDDYWSYHGSEIPFLGFEELTNWPNSGFYTRMMSCCRASGHPNMPRIIRATTNPSGPGMHWVKKRFRLPQSRFEPFQAQEEDENGNMVLAKPRLAIFSSYKENQPFLESNPDYDSTLRTSARSQAELQAWLLGDWDVALGGLFSDLWDRAVHVIPKLRAKDIPSGWKLDRALDWGSSKPFAYGLFAESDGEPIIDRVNLKAYGAKKGDVIMLEEWYGCTGKPNEGLNLTAAQIAQGIKDREAEWGYRGRVRAGPADHNIFAKDRGPTMHKEMQKKGIKFVPADKGQFSRARGWQVMRDYLFQAKDRERTQPGFFVTEACQHAIIHIPATTRDPKNTDDTDNEEDHIQDMVRYRLRRINRTTKQGSG